MTAIVGRCASFMQRNASRLAFGLVVLVTAYSIWCGLLGIDFGEHWDEHYHVSGVRECVDRLELLPQRYIYGNVYFLVGIAIVLAHDPSFFQRFVSDVRPKSEPDLVNLTGLPSVQRFQVSARALLDSHGYLLEARTVFFCLSALVSLWVYLICRKLRPERPVAAAGAAVFVALSWELHYHQRFVAVDAILAQVVAASLFLLSGAWLSVWRRSFLWWYGGAAAAAGVAFACKVTGLVVLLPVLLLPLLIPQTTPRRHRFGLMLFAAAVFFGVANVLQPATTIDPLRVFATLNSESVHYGGSHADHPSMTHGFFERGSRFMTWLWLAVPSPYVGAALLLSAIAVFGVYQFVRTHRRLSALGGVLVGPLCVLVCTHPLMIVRQFLMLIPVLAVGFGVGLAALQERLTPRHPWAWRALLALVVLIFVANGRWLHATAVEIREATRERILEEVTADLVRQPAPVKLSPELADELPPRLAARYRCGPGDPGVGAPILIHFSEWAWHDAFGLSRHMYGAQSANYDWYPAWRAKREVQPILLLSPARARSFKVPFDGYTLCVPNPA